ncbi:sporulation initiation inhibitor Soj [Clostridia bacterium]|nr:sporulation initiation inhibitor Soj [Clostridia bacterium]GHV31475.1 sporulation initiation inhibitor Soj [Clostridia bacterium]
MGKIIAISNEKGGVGKTTTTLNLGARLAARGKRVLLIDADPQANLTMSVGVDAPDTLGTTITQLMKAVAAEQGGVKTLAESCMLHSSGMDIIPSNVMLGEVPEQLNHILGREYIMRELLEPFKTDYDYVLIDCQPSLGFLPKNAWTAADSVIIPCEPEYYSSEGVELILACLRQIIRKRINPDLKIEGILITKLDSRTRDAAQTIANITEAYGGALRIYETRIPKSVKASEAAYRGKTLFEHAWKSPIAQSYAAFGDEFLRTEA